MKRIFTLFVLAAIMFAGRAKAQYLYNMPITVTNNVNSTVVGWQLAIYVNTATPVAANQMKADGRDIRFSKDCIGTQLLDYFIDSGMNTSKTKIWVRMDTLYPSASRTIYMLYGNNTATAATTFNTFNGPYSATNKVTGGTSGGSALSQRGFRFSPNSTIIMSSMGKNEPTGTTRYVTLFDFTTKAILRQVQVSGPASAYSYLSLNNNNHLWLTKNTQYTIQLYSGSGDGYFYQTSSQINAALTYYDMQYCNSCTETTFPNTVLTTYHYGYPDFEFYTVDTNNIATAPTYTFAGGGGGGNARVEFGTMPQICPGTTVANVPFTSTFGSPAKYNIVWDATALSAGFTNVTNATFPGSSPLAVNVPVAVPMGIYRGTFTPSNQCGPGTDANIEIYVAQPVVIDPHDQPKDTTACPRDPAGFSIKAVGAALSYQWQYKTGTSGTWTNLSNGGNYANVNTTDLGVIAQNAYNGYIYRCVVSSGCATPLNSAEGVLAVNVDPVITTDPADVAATQGQNVYFEIQAQGNAKYQWQAAAKNGIFVNINDGGVYQGVKTNKLQVAGVSVAQDSYHFRCLLFNASTCFTPGDTSYAALLTVTPPESVNIIGNNSYIKVYPNPANGNELSITTANTLTGSMSYKIYDNAGRLVASGKLVNNGVTKADITTLTAGVYFVEVTAEDNRVERVKFTRL